MFLCLPVQTDLRSEVSMWKKKMLEALQSCSGPDWPPGESCTKKKREKNTWQLQFFFATVDRWHAHIVPHQCNVLSVSRVECEWPKCGEQWIGQDREGIRGREKVELRGRTFEKEKSATKCCKITPFTPNLSIPAVVSGHTLLC